MTWPDGKRYGHAGRTEIIPLDIWTRYHYDAEYHAWVHLVGALCEHVGRLRAKVNA